LKFLSEVLGPLGAVNPLYTDFKNDKKALLTVAKSLNLRDYNGEVYFRWVGAAYTKRRCEQNKTKQRCEIRCTRQTHHLAGRRQGSIALLLISSRFLVCVCVCAPCVLLSQSLTHPLTHSPTHREVAQALARMVFDRKKRNAYTTDDDDRSAGLDELMHTEISTEGLSEAALKHLQGVHSFT
jgi:hypothetical protein